jgi:hypothetical protein
MVGSIRFGSDLTALACGTIPKARVDGPTVNVVGYRAFREQSHEFAVRLPAGSQSVTFMGVDSDGSRDTVPITK